MYLFLIACLLAGGDPADNELVERVLRPTAESLDQAIRELGDSEFTVRERASTYLSYCGARARGVLDKAGDIEDLEVKTRARQILKQLGQKRVPPEIADPRLRRIVQCRYGSWDEGLRELIKLDDIQTAELLFEEVERAERPRLSQVYVTIVIHSVRKCLLEQRIDDAEHRLRRAVRQRQLTDQEAILDRHLAAFLKIRGVEPSALKQPAAAEELGDDARRKNVLAWLLRMRGEFGAQHEFSYPRDARECEQVRIFERRDWPALFAQAEQDTTSVLRGTTLRLALLPDLERETKSADVLRELGERVKEKPEYLTNATSELILADHPDDALALARDFSRREQFRVLVGGLRFKEAFAALGAPLAPRDPEKICDVLRQELAEAKSPNSRHASSQLAYNISLVARNAAAVGEMDLARQLMLKAGHAAESDQPSGWALNWVWRDELKLGQTEQAWRHLGLAVLNLQQRQPRREFLKKHALQKEPDWCGPAMCHKHAVAAGVWWEYFSQTEPDVSLDEQVRRVVVLLEPDAISTEPMVGAEAWIERFRQHARELPEKQRPSVLQAAAEASDVHEYRALSQSLWTDVEQLRPTSDSALALGLLLETEKKWGEAAEWYARGWSRDRGRLFFLVLQVRALRKAGRAAEAERVHLLARLWPLGDAYARLEMAYAPRRRHDARLTHDQYAEARPFVDHQYLANIYMRRAAELADSDPAEAAALWHATRLNVLADDGAILISDNDDSPFTAEREIVQNIHQLRAMSRIAAGQHGTALNMALKAEAAYSAGYARPVEVVLAFDRAGARARADELFEKLWHRRTRVLEDFPDAAAFHEQLGEIGADCGRRLDESLQHAERAVALRPGKSSALVALAKVHHARGDAERAKGRLADALRLDPGSKAALRFQRKLQGKAAPSADDD